MNAKNYRNALVALTLLGLPVSASAQDAAAPVDAPQATEPAAEVTAAAPEEAVAPEAEVQEEPATTQATEAVASEAAASEPTAEATVAVEAAPEEEMELSAAELEALGFTVGEEAPAVDTDLKIYGFIDMTASMGLSPEGSNWYGTYLPTNPSFAVGNLNVYLSKNLTEDVRTMAEVRFTYLPNEVTNDYNDFGQEIRHGSIEIERVYLDWAAHRYLNLRFGNFLTAYGIWNVDHGSPTIIPVSRPLIVSANIFPERQTGIEASGRVDASADDTIGYHLAISNGKGNLASYRDLDNNKAVSGRLFWQNRALGELKIGVSAYYGTNTQAEVVGTVVNGVLTFPKQIEAQNRSLSLAMDVQWKLDGLLLQTEWLSEQRKTTDAGGALSVDRFDGQLDFPADEVFSWGGYALAGYRLDFLGIMPYVLVQYQDHVIDLGARFKQITVLGGLNIRPIDAVAVKLEYSHGVFPDGNFLSDDPIQLLQAQLAWAF